MSQHDANVARWVLDAVTTGVPYKVWDDWTFGSHYREAIKNQMPAGARRRDFPYLYYSPNRPISLTWARGLEGCLVVTAPGGTKSYVASPAPLDLEVVYKLELLPVGEARADALLALLDDDDFPLVMAKHDREGRTLAALASPDPSRPDKWRVTYFEEDVGPFGHTEVDDARAAVSTMLDKGYNRMTSRDLIDDLMPI